MGVRVRARMSDELVERIDEAAKRLGMSRSEAIQLALERHLEVLEAELRSSDAGARPPN